MVVCKCANHSFGLNYSLRLLKNNMKFLIKRDVCILGVACLCSILHCIGVCVCVCVRVCDIHEWPHVTYHRGVLVIIYCK